MKIRVEFARLLIGMMLTCCAVPAQTGNRELWVDDNRITLAKLQVIADRDSLDARFARWLDIAVADLKRLLPEFGVGLSDDAAFSILIGGEVPEALRTAAAKERYSDQTSVIQITDRAIHITSPAGRGLAKAIYTFLDRIGVRWYTPGKWGEVLPDGRIELSTDAVVEGPDFMFRSFYWSRGGSYPPDMDADYRQWYRRMRMDSDFGFGGHSYSEQIVQPKKYAASHPEYYSLIGGVRIISGADVEKTQFGDHQLCVSNKEVQQLAIDFARQHFQKSELYRFVSISPNDSSTFCQCAPCGEIGGPSHQTVFLANVVARAIAGEHPDKLVAFYAYSNHLRVPEKRRLEPNVAPYIVNSYAELGLYGWQYYAEPLRGSALGKVIEEWGDSGGQTAIRFNWGTPQYPFNWASHLQDDFRFFLENKAVGAMAESGNSFVHQGLLNYWAARLTWNVDLDIEGEAAVFYRDFYGAGADVAKRVLTSIQNRAELELPVTMPLELLQDNERLLNSAVENLPDNLYRRRLVHLLHYLRFLLAREQYLQGKTGVAGIDPALQRIQEDRSYAIETQPGAYSNAAVGKFKRVRAGAVDSWREPLIVYRHRQQYAVKVEAPDSAIRLHVWNGRLGDNDEVLEITVLASDGRIVARKSVPIDTTVDETIPVPQPDTYLLRVKARTSNLFRLEIENPLFVVRADAVRQFHPFASAKADNDDKWHSFKTDGMLTRYFYVPHGAGYFMLQVDAPKPSEWVTFQVITPDGKVLLSKEKWVGHESFKITVPPAAVGKIWQLGFRNGEDVAFAFSPHIPGWLASHPKRLIVPEKYLAQ